MRTGRYTVRVPSLPGCISEGATWEEALAQIEEAISGYIEVARKLGKPIPVEISVPLNTSNAGTEVPVNYRGEGGQTRNKASFEVVGIRDSHRYLYCAQRDVMGFSGLSGSGTENRGTLRRRCSGWRIPGSGN